MSFLLRSIFPLVFAVVLLVTPTRSFAAVLIENTLWSGEVALSEDVIVPEGVTLTIAPGTTVKVSETQSTKTDPEYLSPLVELTVRGRLRVSGTAQAPVRFVVDGGAGALWAGIIVDGGAAELEGCRIESAENAVYLVNGTVQLNGCRLSGNRYGVVVAGENVTLSGVGNLVTDNEYGVALAAGVTLPPGTAAVVKNRKKDLLSLDHRPLPPYQAGAETQEKGELTRRYRDAVLPGETVWSGRVEVDGTVRVPEGGRLVILPGTVVEFAFRDTNGDGIGESGLMVQGTILAKGESHAPITFRSKDGKKRGGWDAINIMNSAARWNLVEYCRFQGAYRALHFHFSRVAVTNTLIRGCYRAMQFQESTVLLRDNLIVANKSGVQGRDSELTLTGNEIRENFQGINLLRTRLVAVGNRVLGNVKEGFRIREGDTVFQENLVDGNRFGLLVADAFFGAFVKNSFSNNAEIGFSLKNMDNLDIAGNFISGNGVNGINIQESGGRVHGNQISDNRERGAAVQSFTGSFEENNVSGNGRLAVELGGEAGMDARRNWWGGEDPARIVSDGATDPGKGRVDCGQEAREPFRFHWPVAAVETDTSWRDAVVVGAELSVAPGATLSVAPDTKVFFAPGAGLVVKGRIVASGEAKKRVAFTALTGRAPESWGEIRLEHADGSRFSNCTIEYATWGLHSHFTRLEIDRTSFRHNQGGMRFRSGPVRVERSEFRGNGIGIRSYQGVAELSQNVITGNRVGVFVREKGGGLVLRRNSLFANEDFNIRLGDFNTEDVDARENWWGGGEPTATLFDGRTEPGIGTIRYAPWLRKPFLREGAP